MPHPPKRKRAPKLASIHRHWDYYGLFLDALVAQRRADGRPALHLDLLRGQLMVEDIEAQGFFHDDRSMMFVAFCNGVLQEQPVPPGIEWLLLSLTGAARIRRSLLGRLRGRLKPVPICDLLSAVCGTGAVDAAGSTDTERG